MRLTRKRSNVARLRGVSRAATEGASREELVREALICLARVGEADRFGVWLRSQEVAGSPRSQETFQGAVWELDGEEPPRAWMHLAPEPPLPMEQLLAGRAVRQEHSSKSHFPLLGPAAGLRVVLWVPVQHSGRLLGIVLGGSRSTSAELPLESMEALAAELSLIVQLEEERSQVRRRRVDAQLSAQILGDLAEGRSPAALLQRIVESCVQETVEGGPGAQMAAIGRRGDSAASAALQGEQVEFPWKAGNPEWLGALASQPLFDLCKSAFDSGRTVGTEFKSTWVKGRIFRAVAIPLTVSGRPRGLLAAVLAEPDASLASLERLELRASIAAGTLAALQRKEEEEHRDFDEKVLADANERAVLVVDRTFRVLLANRAAREQFSDLLADGEPKMLAEWFGVEDRGAAENWMQELKTASQTQRGTLRTEFRNGKRIQLSHEGTTARGTMLLSIEPVQEPAEKNESAPAELAALIEWLDQGVILFDAKNEIRGMNPRFAQLFGLPIEEPRHPPDFQELVRRIAPRTADPEIFARRWQEIAYGADSGIREEVHLANPVSRVLERVSRSVVGPRGNRLGRIELYRDLTSQRILQSRLLHTEKLAALGQMITGVAHELSNPLTSIVGYAQRLLLRKDETGLREEVHRIFAEAERATAILRQMLLSARETPPERRPLSLNQIIQRTVELQRFSLAAEKIRVELDLDPLVAPILGDAGQLQQVLLNLFGNARQAIESQGKGGAIRVSTTRVDSGERIRLEISDTGPGIPEEMMARIFDPFFTTKPAGVGTGLGLAIVLGIVREHGGQVFVKSPSGKGAVFTIDLPASSKAPYSGEPYGAAHGGRGMGLGPETPASRVSTSENKTPARCALVVEDEPTVAQLIADVLRDEGFRVETVLSGRNAQGAARSRAFDLVICDMKMPGFDGSQFYRALAREGNPLQHRFLFVTGDVLASHTQEFLRESRIPYVAKPFRVDELVEKVNRVLAEAGEAGTTSSDERKNIATKG